jgi:multidrug efflux pump subunit AcrA (membrane-fusion protein)
LSAAGALLLTLTAASCGEDTSGIDLGRVGHATVVEVVDAPATVVAKASATLTAPADGTLAELAVSPGDEVAADQVLAVVDSPVAQRQLAQAGEALAAASRATAGGGAGGGDLAAGQRATDAAAAAAFAQAREAAGHVADETLRAALLAQIEVAEERYAAASAAAREAVRAVQEGVASLGAAVAALGTAQQLQARQAYDLALATVDALTLRAPFAGVVQLGGVAGGEPEPGLGGLLDAVTGGLGGAPDDGAGPGVDQLIAVGTRVGAGTPVLTVVDVTELGLVAEVDETDVLLVEPGVTARVELDAAPGARYGGTVRAVDLLPTPSARGGVAYRVKLTLGSGSWPDGSDAPAPRPGMSAIAQLRVREAANALVVPAAAVLRVEDADVVWLVRGGVAERTVVQIGVQGVDLVQITSGLRSGDQVVVRGADQVSEGQRLP